MKYKRLSKSRKDLENEGISVKVMKTYNDSEKIEMLFEHLKRFS